MMWPAIGLSGSLMDLSATQAHIIDMIRDTEWEKQRINEGQERWRKRRRSVRIGLGWEGVMRKI